MKSTLFFFLFILFGCSSKFIPSREPIGIKIDSIYINELEKGDTIRYQLMVFYYCTIKSSYDSTINIGIKNYPSEEKSEAKSYLIYSKDTLNLYLETRHPIKVPPKGKVHFGLETNTINMVDLFEKHGYSFEDHKKAHEISEVDFLKKIVRESKVFFEWRGFKTKMIDLEKAKIIYRDPNNHTIE